MKNSLIALILLVFEFTGSFAHSIANVDIEDHTDTSVYANQEDPDLHTIKFIHPQPGKPTLREIIDYRVIERPYGQVTPDRPFTNAHARGMASFEDVRRDHNDYIENINENTTVKPEILTDNITITDADTKIAKDGKEVVTVEDTTQKAEGLIDGVDHFRRERDARMQVIPDAPAIPRIKYEIFPAYLRQMIFAERPDLISQRDLYKDKPKLKQVNYDKTRRTKAKHEGKTVEERIRELKDTLQSSEELNEEEEVREPKTYGMNLRSDDGYVWNDIFTDPGISYDVGEFDKRDESEVDIRKETTPLAENPNIEKENTDVETSDTEKGPAYNRNEDLDDIFVHIMKSKQNNHPNSGHNYKEEDKRSEEIEDLDDEENAVGELFEDILLSDEFWNWASIWNKMIMDTLKRFTIKTVEAEVKKQLETHLETNKQKDIPLSSQKLNAATADMDEESENSNKFEIKDNKLIIDGTEIPLKDVFDFNTDEEKAADGNHLKKRKNIKKKPSHIVDIDNNQELNNTVEINKKNQTSFKVHVQNVYGNAVGSDKVTNIFIFYPKKGIDKIIQELKPIADKNGTYIINSSDKEDTDDNKDITVQEEKEETNSKEKESDSNTESTATENDKANESDNPTSGSEKETATDSEKTEENLEKDSENEKGGTASEALTNITAE